MLSALMNLQLLKISIITNQNSAFIQKQIVKNIRKNNALEQAFAFMLRQSQNNSKFPLKLLSSSTIRSKISSNGNNIEFMGHVVFTRSVVFIWGVQT